MEEQEDIEDMGGTMRLGLYACRLAEDSLARTMYGEEVIYERHRHRWEVNNKYRSQLEEAGMVLSGMSPDRHLVEMIELPDHPFFVASQFHPEFKSRPDEPHPLFAGLVAAAAEYASRSRTEEPARANERVG
jgi:CTP synthase